MNTSSRTRTLVEGAMLIALATILSYLKFYDLPQGGSITLEMLPLILMAFRHGTKWGVFTGLVHGMLQMMIGFHNVMYCNTLLAQVGCILLDYLVAFSVLGLAPAFRKMAKDKQQAGLILGTACAGLLRFLCSFLSGWLLWGSYAPEGKSAIVYSLLYNGSYMIPDIVIHVIIIVILAKVAPMIVREQIN